MRVFIGSSKEAKEKGLLLKIAGIVENCKKTPICWDQTPSIFELGKHTLENLDEIISREKIGASIFICTSDDQTWFRDKSVGKPRDNVIFEHGLFMGKLGRTRSIIVKCGDVDLPSDLNGITYLDFSENQRINGEINLKAWLSKLPFSIESSKFLNDTCTNNASCRLRFLADENYRLGNEEHHNGNIKKALNYLEKAEKYYMDLDDNVRRADTLLCMSINERILYKKSIKSTAQERTARSLIEEEWTRLEDPSIYKNFAVAASRQGNYEAAREYYSKAESICLERKDINSLSILADTLRLRGILEGKPELDNLENANKIFINAFEKYVELGDKAGQASVYQAMGDAEREHKNYKCAVNKYESARLLYDETNEPVKEFCVIGELCRAYALAKEKHEALKCVSEAERILNQMPDPLRKYVNDCINETYKLLGMEKYTNSIRV